MSAKEKIEGIGSITDKKRVGLTDLIPEVKTEKTTFDALMAQQKTGETGKVANLEKPALDPEKIAMSDPNKVQNNPALTKTINPADIPSTADLVTQTQEAKDRIKLAKATLESPDARLKPGYETQLKNRLVHIDDKLRIALSKAGTEYNVEAPKTGTEVAHTESMLTPVQNFLGYLTHAQDQLDGLGNYLEGLQGKGKELSIANMLAIQIKVTHIQQELEFFTNLLNKALESQKTLMNVQV